MREKEWKIIADNGEVLGTYDCKEKADIVTEQIMELLAKEKEGGADQWYAMPENDEPWLIEMAKKRSKEARKEH